MTSPKLTKRHLSYLLKFKKKKRCGDSCFPDTDIRKLLRLQDGNYTCMFTLILFFSVFSSGGESLISKGLPLTPSIIVLLCAALFLAYRGYWIHRSITFMVNSEVFNLDELPEFKTEQGAAGNPLPAE
jgi:hypothetical protein